MSRQCTSVYPYKITDICLGIIESDDLYMDDVYVSLTRNLQAWITGSRMRGQHEELTMGGSSRKNNSRAKNINDFICLIIQLSNVRLRLLRYVQHTSTTCTTTVHGNNISLQYRYELIFLLKYNLSHKFVWSDLRTQASSQLVVLLMLSTYVFHKQNMYKRECLVNTSTCIFSFLFT